MTPKAHCLLFSLTILAALAGGLTFHYQLLFMIHLKCVFECITPVSDGKDAMMFPGDGRVVKKKLGTYFEYKTILPGIYNVKYFSLFPL